MSEREEVYKVESRATRKVRAQAWEVSWYIPQVYENWRRKSTDGWNIWNVLLDFGGGSLSICQLMIDCGSTGNWSGLTGDPVKFLLGFVSIIFDLVFMIQHYCLYRFFKLAGEIQRFHIFNSITQCFEKESRNHI